MKDENPAQRRNPYRQVKGFGAFLGRLFRLVLLFAGIFTVTIAGIVLYAAWSQAQSGSQVHISTGNTQLNPAEYFYLQSYLKTRAARLGQPAGIGQTPTTFVIAPGETANIIAANLATQNLLTDLELFVNYVRYYGLDAQLKAGSYELSPHFTIPELAAHLTRAIGQEITVRFLEGWRLEEMANYLQTTTPAQVQAEMFLAIVRRQTTFDITGYDFLASMPAQTPLEGYLFPDTYRLPLDADAAYLVNLMLQNFGQQVTPAMRQAYGANGLTLSEAITLASIVEREAILNEERPTVASVFFNRLADGMKLDADPTVQYAIGQQADGRWWKSPLAGSDLQIDSPYNTYLYVGLPPTPIANPGLASLQAVANPAQTSYFYFVANCYPNSPNQHVFSITYEEHLLNVQQCR